MARRFEAPPTLIIPYGLKSWLECICRAVFIERPQNITEFISAYCEELHNFSKRKFSSIEFDQQDVQHTLYFCRGIFIKQSFFTSENILVDTKDVIHMYQEIRGKKYKQCIYIYFFIITT